MHKVKTMTTFAKKVIQFNKQLSFTEKLPNGIRIMNPFRDNPEIISIAEVFYDKFYNDNRKRKLILGINPGRLGAGATGIPFTDTKRLHEICDIKIESVSTHEPSSVFVYELIGKYGGAKKFYNNFYINSICPLGFIEKNEKQNWVNRNYYDYDELFFAMRNFITESLKKQISFGIDTGICFVLGKKNAKFLKLINEKENFFHSIVAFDHPRYIEQYKSRQKNKYISEYLGKLSA
jgi:hypothetical protein